MAIKLKNIADISTGLVISRKKAITSSEVVKSYKQLNLRSFHKSGFIIYDELENFLAKEAIEDNYLTKEGDIIIRLTDPFTAIYITKKEEGLVISSNFCIIRCNDTYNPIFLAYYINGDTVKKFLTGNTQGYVVKNIGVIALQDIALPNISVEMQALYGKLFDAQLNKNITLEKIKNLEESIQKNIISQIGYVGGEND